MEQHHLTDKQMDSFSIALFRAERSPATIEKYLRSIRTFFTWLDGRPVTKDVVMGWREHLLTEQRLSPSTVNTNLSALSGLFNFLGWEECRVKFLKVQRKMFRDSAKELTKSEYERLVETARAQGKTRLALVMETICATGIRVSEVQYITIEAVKAGRATISLKGKIRTILLPGKLCRKLLKYAKKQKTISGKIFLTGNGRPLSRHQIWVEMKRLCLYAGVNANKVFPHNLRHLFATIYYKACKDIARLADVLGHSSIETTRIYLLTSGTEHQRQLEYLGLVL